jgi:hypothetical protein
MNIAALLSRSHELAAWIESRSPVGWGEERTQHFAATGVTLGFLRHPNLPGFSEIAVIDGYGSGAPIGRQETTLNVSMNTDRRKR